MEAPFIYGKMVEKKAFVNRVEDINVLTQNMKAQNNIILISPRRWGKTSLVQRTVKQLVSKDKNYKSCFIDIYKVQNENDFYKAFAEAIINATSGKIDEAMDSVKNFFSAIVPKLSVNPDPNSEISLSMDWEEIKKSPDEILNLPESIAKKKKIKLVICIDEFQNIGSFENPLAFQEKLRASWQYHQNVSYCIFGSKRHMMMELFGASEMPFYKFGSLMFLEKISTAHWAKYIQKEFKRTSKLISKEDATYLAEAVENHSYYVQQLAQLVWFRTAHKCTSEIVDLALDSLQLQLSMLYRQITDTLSKKQVNYLHALINDEKELSSKATIEKYNLGTTGTVARVRSSLEDKDVLDYLHKNISFNDPVYRLWLKNYYFV